MLVATLTLVALSTVFTNVYAKSQYTILDVKKDPRKSVNDYKEMLKDIQVEHSFKTLGSSRLIFVVKMNESSYNKLSKINLPGDAFSIAAGDLGDKMRSLGLEWKSWEDLPSTNLTLFERTLELKGEPTEGVFAHLRTYGEILKPVLDMFPNKGFVPLGHLPPKVYFFVSLPFRSQQVTDGSNVAINFLKGPGASSTKIEFVAKV